MLRQGLIITAHRNYAQAMREGLLGLGDVQTRVDIELDALRAMQLVPQQYDLILLDAVLDTMDGLQLLLLLKQQVPTVKFIVVSDDNNETLRALAYQNGADYFLERPRSDAALRTALEAIKGLLKRHRESKPLPDDQDGPVLDLADIVRTRCLSGDSVLLLVTSKTLSGDIFLFRGEIFHAQYPGKSGEAAFNDIMGWDGGQVRVKTLKLSHTPPRTIEIPYAQLLDGIASSGALTSDVRPPTGELLAISAPMPSDEPTESVVQEAPPLPESSTGPVPALTQTADLPAVAEGETALPALNSHWKINLMGELVEGSQMAEPDRCAFISYFIYRKMADVAVALEVDYFNEMTLFGPHLQQVLVADNMGVHHAVFDTAWTNEDKRVQYMKWCSEQSL